MANYTEELRQNTEKLIRQLNLLQKNLKNTNIHDIRFINKIMKLENAIGTTMNVLEELMDDVRTIHINVVAEGKQYIKIDDIIYVEARNHCSIIHTTNGNKKCRNSILEIEKMLEDEGFYRCHKSYLINLYEILSYDDYVVYMSNNEKAYVSRRKKTEFKKLINEHNTIYTLRRLKLM